MVLLFLIKFNTHYKSQNRMLLAPNYILPNLILMNSQFKNWIPYSWDDANAPWEAQAPVTPTSLPASNLNSFGLFLDTDPSPSWALRHPPSPETEQQQHRVQGPQVQRSWKG